MNQSSKIVSLQGIDEVSIVMREVDGKDLLFTSDGKLISGQMEDAGHVYYQNVDGFEPNRKRKCFRQTFVFGDKFCGGEPLKIK